MMSEFILSDRIDENKIFLINHSQLEDRFDVPFYQENMDFTNCIKLSKIAKVSGGKRLPKGFDYSKETTQYRYLRIGNIKWDSTLEYSNFKYLSEELYNILNNYEIHNDDLLLAIVGATIGKCSLLNIPNDNKIILTENCAKIKVIDVNILLPHYLLFLLQSNFVQKQIQLNYVQTTLPKLGLDRVLSLYLPSLPSKKRQQELLDIYQSAFLLKKQKEKQAKDLLENIDTYLLEVLGITLPQIDNSLEKRIFKVNLSEISGGRFDCDYYSYKYEILQDTILKAKTKDIDIEEIDSVVSIIKGGKTPASHEYSDIKTSFPIVKAGSYTDEYINLDKLGYTKEENNFEVQKGDIFILSAAHQSHYVGRQIKILNKNIDTKISYVGELICIRTIEELCNSMYLFSLLNLEIYKTLLNREKTGQTSHIYGKDIKKIKIPLPSIEKQNEIAEHIQTTRDNAKQLQNEAKQDLENAKLEVEKMILG